MWVRPSNSHRLVRTTETMADPRDLQIAELTRKLEELTRQAPAATLNDTLRPIKTGSASAFVWPADTNTFNFKPGVVPLLPTFHGVEKENPYQHLKDFMGICQTCFDDKTSEEAVYIRLFPFTLKDKAKHWLDALPPNSINNWLELQAEFLKKFFPLHRTQALTRQIMNYAQMTNETFPATWERYNDLLRACPHVEFDLDRKIGFFYGGLQAAMKQLVELMCNGKFFDKTAEDAWQFLEDLAENAKTWDSSSEYDRSSSAILAQQPTHGGMFALKPEDALSAKMDAMLSKKLQELELRGVKEVSVEQACVLCNESGHDTSTCPTLPALKVMLENPTEVNQVNSNFQNFNNNSNYQGFNKNWKSEPKHEVGDLHNNNIPNSSNK